MKRLSFFVAAAAAILSATTTQAAPKKIIENDVTIYSIDTYKSENAVRAILAETFEVKANRGGVGNGAIFAVSKPVASRGVVLSALGKIGTAEVKQNFTLNTLNGKSVPLSVGEIRKLANGSENGKPRTRDVKTGLFAKTTTSQKNGSFKVAYEQQTVDVVDVKNAVVAGDKFEVALVQETDIRASARLKKGDSMVLAGFSKDAAKGFFGKKNRVLVTVVTPRSL